MIQFNLLPDIKIKYMKTKRTRRMVIVSSIAIAGVSVLLLVITFSYRAAQSNHLSDLNKDVESIKSELEGNEELTRMLSVQGQIAALPALYNQRPEVTRLSEYIAKTTPPSINLSKYSLDFEAGTIEITGTGESVSAVNKYVDVLRFAKFRYKVSDGEDYSPLDNAFTDVVLTSFSKDTSSETAGKSNFTASFKFNAMIFDALQIVDLQVPQATTTHNQEAGIFSGTAVEGTGQGGN